MADKKEIPVEMEKVHRRFERWRKTRRGRAPIPERLWTEAASLAREHGVNQTSQALGLEFNKLRSFVESGKTRRKKVKTTLRPSSSTNIPRRAVCGSIRACGAVARGFVVIVGVAIR